MKLHPTAECQAPRWSCGWVETFNNYKEAKRAAIKHHNASGHVVRVELINTELIGWQPANIAGEGDIP